MAVEGIAGVATYQAPVQTKATPKVEMSQSANSIVTEAATSSISKDTRIVGSASASAGDDGQSQGDLTRQPSEESVKKAISDINKQLSNTECVFGVHEETNRVMIRIVDKTSKEVLKELPPEKTLDMIAKVWEIAGLLVDERL